MLHTITELEVGSDLKRSSSPTALLRPAPTRAEHFLKELGTL